jgi:hypothetical protein
LGREKKGKIMPKRTYRELQDKDQYRKQFNLELRRRARKRAQDREKAVQDRRLLEGCGQLRIPGIDNHGEET